MPVRVKQRHLASEDKGEQERLWKSLKQSIVALLVASGCLVSLRLRDTSSLKSLTLLGLRDRHALEIRPGPPEKLRMALSTLQQAGLVSPSSTGSWVPVSASSRSIVIRGGISLEPAPSKTTQFISLGISPLSQSSHNELYDHVNRQISRSCFGIVEEELLTETERLRRQHDRRFKQDGLTNKQLLAEKGVDRWPMFVLGISFKENGSRYEHQTLDGDAKLTSVINVLDALVSGWLTSNNFLPQKRKKGERDSLSEDQSPANEKLLGAKSTRVLTIEQPLVHREEQPTSRQRLISPTRPCTEILSMNELSRIKSADRSLLEQSRPYNPSSKRPQTAPNFAAKDQTNIFSRSIERAKTSSDQLAYISQLSRRDSQLTTAVSKDENPRESEPVVGSQSDKMQDEVMNWTDPITKRTHQINSRTGAIIAPEPSGGLSKLGGSSRPDRGSQNILPRSLRLPARFELAGKPDNTNGWLEGVLKNWRNPVFRCAEKSIQQASLHLPGEESGAISTGKFNFTTTTQIDQAFKEVSHLNASKITKEALRSGKVISQVDEKFILVALRASRNASSSCDSQRTMLVMIDQHAADERVKVEQLMQKLSRPSSNSNTEYTSTLGYKSRVHTSLLSKSLTFRISAREIEHFRSYAACFAVWGILYDLPCPPKSSSETDDSDIVVRCLPPVIAERCRLDPKLLINLLRTELWKLVDSSSSYNRTAGTDVGHDWLKTIGTFPQGLLDMVNSRACRSAIMFNDALSKEDCELLVAELAKCKFPFMCAHGRPSMVPLLDLGELGGSERRTRKMAFGSSMEKVFGGEEAAGSDFVGAFGKWREDMALE